MTTKRSHVRALLPAIQGWSSRCLVLSAALQVGAALPAHGQVVRQLTDHKAGYVGGITALDDAGTTLWTIGSLDFTGSNPGLFPQMARWDALTGSGQLVTSFPKGTGDGFTTSVSDDGQWLAFLSDKDLVGQNHDLSVELFVMRSDGAQLAQLTNDPALNASSVYYMVMAGGGSKIVFQSDSDPLGTNADHVEQIFVIDRDGTGLRQLTNNPGGGPYFQYFDISDDGQRVVYSFNGNPIGGNADGNFDIFAIQSDGTNLRQLTNSTTPGRYTALPVISGNGTKVAFNSDDNLTGQNLLLLNEVFIINWDGTGLRQLTRSSTSATEIRSSEYPSITDDGLVVVFSSNQKKTSVNVDGNYEIWKVRTDGTGLTALTNTTDSPGEVFAVVSGSGNRIAYLGQKNPPPGAPDVYEKSDLSVMDSNGGNVHILSSGLPTRARWPDITPDGSRVVLATRADLLGTNPDGKAEIYRIEADGSGLAQVTSFNGFDALSPSITTDGNTIVFASAANPTGGNADGSQEIFLIKADGTGIRQLTSGAAGTVSQTPVIARNGSYVVFASNANLGGGNADGSQEIYRIKPDGTGLQQLTSATSGASQSPRVDSSGVWVAFQTTSNLDGGPDEGTSRQVYRVRTDGSGLQRLSTGTTQTVFWEALSPTISADGLRIAYVTNQDMTGGNPDHVTQLVLFQDPGGVTRQLTSFTDSTKDLRLPGISGDGAWVYFSTSQEIFEEDEDYPTDLYRIDTATNAIERAGGPKVSYVYFFDTPAVDYQGNRVAFMADGDMVETNRDIAPEIWLLDRTVSPQILVNRAAPTTVSWDPEIGKIRYDVIRGDVANLSFVGSTVDLGQVSCLENDSPDANTDGDGDSATPSPGHAFFFLYRGTQGMLAGPGSFGQASNGNERVAGAGVCAP